MSKNSSCSVLLGGLKEGNKKAFCRLFELYWEPMFVMAKSFLSNDDLAKDIVQNIWVKLWRERERTFFGLPLSHRDRFFGKFSSWGIGYITPDGSVLHHGIVIRIWKSLFVYRIF